IRGADANISTGFLGSALILDALSNQGYHEVAKAILRQRSSGWGKIIELGGTTLWEAWDHPSRGPLIHSAQHMVFSAPGSWLVEHIGGIQSDIPGSLEFSIKPDWQTAGDTMLVIKHIPAGFIKVEWTAKESGGVFHFSIPPNSKGNFYPGLIGIEKGRLMVYSRTNGMKQISLPLENPDDPIELNPGKYEVVWEK
ncbi:MAG: hypothetical protein AAFV07_08640, partial [Bacteroidota bacterium]